MQYFLSILGETTCDLTNLSTVVFILCAKIRKVVMNQEALSLHLNGKYINAVEKTSWLTVANQIAKSLSLCYSLIF